MDLNKARDLAAQLVTELGLSTTPPVTQPAVIATADALDRALSTATPGTVLSLSRTLIYAAPLTIRAPGITLQCEGTIPSGRMTTDIQLPKFLGGMTVPADGVQLIAIEVRHTNPLTDILTFAGKDITLDRCRILGDLAKGAKRGIAANGGGHCAILHCYVDDCFGTYPGSDTQAICAWDMLPGLVIEDNYLRAGSETLMLGGADPASEGRIPADVIIRGNTITARPEWQPLPIGVKTRCELKNAKRVLIEQNIIEYCWGGHGQDGYLMSFTPRNQGGLAPWSTIEDITVKNNTCAHAAAAINLLGTDSPHVSGRMARVTFTGNTFTDIDPTLYGGSNRLILIGDGPTEVTLDGNTFAGAHIGSQVYFYGAPPCQQLIIRNNTWPKSKYGIFGDNTASAKVWATFVASGILGPNTETA